MGILEEKIKKFLELTNSFGYGYGHGYGSGTGYGSGDGSGYGSGSGAGSGDGSGYGSGNGSGSGYGSGSGAGSSYGNGLKSFNNNRIYKIDNIRTIITHISKNIAKGFILKNNFLLEPCYIVKRNNLFAHGKTIKEAMQSLQAKIFRNMDIEEIISQFVKKFKKTSKYKGTKFYEWHHILTGSCEMGRDNFVKEHELDLNKMYSVNEFIELTENDYGGEIIKKLKEFYN